MKQEKNNKNAGISERILQIISNQDITNNKFAISLGYSRSQTIYDIINGKSAPSYDFFNRFINSEYSAIYNIEWLITGRGEMLKKEEPEVEKKEFGENIFKELLKEKKELLKEKEKENNELHREIGRLEKEIENLKNGRMPNVNFGTAINNEEKVKNKF